MFVHRLVVGWRCGARRAPNVAKHFGAAVGDTPLQLRAILDPGFSDPDSHSTTASSANRADGNSEIEDKSMKGSGERVGKGANLKFALFSHASSCRRLKGKKNVKKNVLTLLHAVY